MTLPPNPAAWPTRYRELLAERAAIMEYEGNLSRPVAEIRAEQDVRKLAAEERQKEKASA
jgi:hypothetical protein